MHTLALATTVAPGRPADSRQHPRVFREKGEAEEGLGNRPWLFQKRLGGRG